MRLSRNYQNIEPDDLSTFAISSLVSSPKSQTVIFRCLDHVSSVCLRGAARKLGCASARDRYPRPPGFSSIRVTSQCASRVEASRSRRLPRATEVVRAALAAARQREHGALKLYRRLDVVPAISSSNVTRESIFRLLASRVRDR